MPGFVGLLAAFVCLWAGLRSSGASVELRSSGEEGAVSGGCPARCRCSVDGLLHRADCSDLGLRETPGNLSVFTSYLDLSMNNLTALTSGALSNLHFLEELRLAGNDLSIIPRGAFSGLYNLKVPAAALNELPALQAMTLALNHISHVPDYAFSKLDRLVVLHLNNNRIVSTGTNCFHGLHSLETLDLNYNSLVEFPTAIRSLGHLKELGFHSNNIQSIPEQAFIGNPSLITISLNGAADLTEFPDLTGTKSLESLDLSYNQIQSLPSFSGCESVQKIDLHHNEIEELEENTFHGLMSLRSLDLSWNRLSSVKRNSFSALPALNKLDLSSNQLSALPLIGLQSLTHLRLAGNSELMELIQQRSCPEVMELPYAFQCCAFVSCERRGASWEKEEAVDSTGKETSVISSQVDQDWEDFLMEFEDEPKLQHTVHCSPAPGPFRPCLHLLGSWLVRLGVWLIAALSLVSNSLVVLSVFFSPLPRYGARWESSFLCRLSGFLCVFASQTGLFLLTVAALERCTAASSRNKPDGHNGILWFEMNSGNTVVAFRHRSPSVSLHLFLLPVWTLRHSPPPGGRSQYFLSLPSSSLLFLLFLLFLPGVLRLPGAPGLVVFPPHDARLHSSLLPPGKNSTNHHHPQKKKKKHRLLDMSHGCFFPTASSSSLSPSSRFPRCSVFPLPIQKRLKALILLVAPLPSCVNPLLFLLFNVAARHDLAALLRLCRGRKREGGGRLPCLDSTYNDNDEARRNSHATRRRRWWRSEERGGRGRGGNRKSEKRSEAFVDPPHKP
ncbi:hypothetical protein F7725_022118 [Dissostichus mawsoni]|uniref:G-protein coupled receptors family 1 profile domain-containing protein n=1 Tax=Dissostichus mawsoni TaxID=36200 RepID=A0A7J5ZFD2_DISMA|nr:hypothetical protein F7725_022118 [Dissostichus mawsoni]